MCAVARSGSNRRASLVAVGSLALVGALSACGADTGQATSVDTAPILIGETPREASQDFGLPARPAYDPRADLDIDDQFGDGRSVVIDSVRVTRDGVHLVVLDERGSILGSQAVIPGVQPVQIDLARPVTTSGDLHAVLVLDDGNGRIDPGTDLPLLDDDDEIIEEDFEYYLR